MKSSIGTARNDALGAAGNLEGWTWRLGAGWVGPYYIEGPYPIIPDPTAD